MKSSIPLLPDFLSETAEKTPEKTAIIAGDVRFSYKEMDQKSNILANRLIEMGVKRGDRVAVFADNIAETAVSFWAIIKAGAISTIINPLTKPTKLKYLITDSRAKVLVCDAHITGVFAKVMADTPSLVSVVVTRSKDPDNLGLDAAIPVVTWESLFVDSESLCSRPEKQCLDIDIATIIYTSGSTGESKGVMLSHRNMITASVSISSYLKMTDSDVVLGILPLAFNYGLYQLIMCSLVGGTLMLERSFSFPGAVLKKIVEEKVTVFPAVPTIFSVLQGLRKIQKFDLSAIRCVTNAGAALSRSHIDFLLGVFTNAEFFSMYGQTECTRGAYLPPKDLDAKIMSVGIPIDNTEVWLVDDDDNKVGLGEVGQLVLRGATVMQGYWEKPEETKKSLRPGPVPGERVLYTGDLFKFDEDRYLYFVSRMDDIIKSRGEKVAPKEVENILYALPEVQDAAVIGVPDEKFGQVVKAFVVPQPGNDLDVKKIMGHCTQNLENFMVPKYLEIVESLPKTESGKIKKIELK